MTSTNEGADILVNMERLRFADESLAFDLGGNAGMTAKILGAVFGADSISNKNYAGIGIGLLDGGMSYPDLMRLALVAKLGASFSDADEVNVLYRNLVGMPPSDTELAYWVGTLSSGQYTQTSLAVMAADHPLNTGNIDLVGLAVTGLPYV
ncbi:MAG: DUF4214 domain-containing protein [Burkholderiales bacterium]